MNQCFTWWDDDSVRWNVSKGATFHKRSMTMYATHWKTLQHTATHCNTLQHTATHCNTLQHTAAHCKTLQYTGTHRSTRWCNSKTLQHRMWAAESKCRCYCASLCVWHYNTPQHTVVQRQHAATHCNTLQDTARHCCTMQHTTTQDVSDETALHRSCECQVLQRITSAEMLWYPLGTLDFEFENQ